MLQKLPTRKRNRLEGFDYGTHGVYFLTVCTKGKQKIFWNDDAATVIVGEDIILPQKAAYLSAAGKTVAKAIEEIPVRYPHTELLQYVVMPNHIHILLWITGENGRIISSPTGSEAKIKTVSTVIGQMKRWVSKELGYAIWQRSFHDHIVRDGHDYEEISQYIRENPLRWTTDCFYTE